jgi:catechol 2,3-dioxygenase-like lactoylglutathione lyase family enzyme
MPDARFIILYVDDPLKSAAFYSDLFGRAPLESSPTFSMIELSPELMLGLWSRHTVEPAAHGAGGDAEIAFTAKDADEVRVLHADWSRRKLPIIQPPRDMDFGHTFVALDPDGHRLRVFAPAVP